MNKLNQIDIKDLHLAYGKKTVLRIDNLTAPDKSLIAVIGRNGSGKSTLLRCIVNLQKANSGEIKLTGKTLNNIKPAERAKLISFVSPHPVNVPQLSVYDLIAGGRAPYTSALNKLTDKDVKHINHAIELLNLSEFKNRMLNELSDGERQKCMIARACAQNTPIMVLDEPTAFLDYPSRLDLLNNLKVLAKDEGKCIIFSSHDIEIALPIADLCWFLENTQLFTGTPDEIKLDKKFISFLR
jgi:iron complex transport system ATP-binding protein